MGKNDLDSPKGLRFAGILILLCLAAILLAGLFYSQCDAEEILLICRNGVPGSTSENDYEHKMQWRLGGLGHNVTAIPDVAPPDVRGYDLLIILGSVSPSEVVTYDCHLLDLPVLICGAGLLEDWFGLEVNPVFSNELVYASELHHFITGKLLPELKSLGFTSWPHVSFGDADFGDGNVLARLPQNGDAALIVYDRGQATGLGDVMPARRALFTWFDINWNDLTDEGWDVFDRTVDWLLGVDTPVVANADPDQIVESGDNVTLDGSRSFALEGSITGYHWEQIIVGAEPIVTMDDYDPPDGIVTFVAPYLEIGMILTFRLTVLGGAGADTDDACVAVRATSAPPQPFARVWIEPKHLGFDLWWEPVGDEVHLRSKDIWDPFWVRAWEPPLPVRGLIEGKPFTFDICVDTPNGESCFGPLTYIPMRNLSLPESLSQNPTPPSTYIYKHSRYSLGEMNDGQYEDHNDSREEKAKSQDYWGYMWEEPLFFNALVYHAGRMAWDGGWFTSLTVQYTEDGVTWKEPPNVMTEAPYDFRDLRDDREDFAHYVIYFAPIRGKGIRIYGTPGGASGYTSISELEVYGDQDQGPLVVCGLDKDVDERRTATLDGSCSFSTRGQIGAYQWEQVSGPAVSIKNATSAVASFDAPGVDEDTVYVFKLTAGDGTEALADEDIRITVMNLQTTADAGIDRQVQEGSTVTLDGTGSVSTSGNLLYQWTQVSGPTVTLREPNEATCNFTAPIIWNYTEKLEFQLEVNDGLGQPDSISTDTASIELKNSFAAPAYPLPAGYIEDLLHLGQFPSDRILPGGELHTDPLSSFGGQARIRAVVGEAYDFSGTGIDVTRNPMLWTPVHSSEGWFANEPVGGHFTHYYHIYVLSPENRQARFHVKHNGALRCWNDAELVLETKWFGESVADFSLHEGLNSMTFRFDGSGEGSYFAVEITDGDDQAFPDLLYSFGPSFVLTDAYAVRSVPNHYQPGGTLEVTLSLRVNPEDKPAGITVSEAIPEGVTVVDAGGGQVIGGSIHWAFSEDQVADQILIYILGIPEDVTGAMAFDGTVSFHGTVADIHEDGATGGEVYEVPAPPGMLTVEFLLAAYLNWGPSESEGAVEYIVYRSVNRQSWEKIAYVSGTSYIDDSIVPGRTYRYRVSAVIRIPEGPACPPSDEGRITMFIREAEDFNYGGGIWPPYQNCPDPVEAPSADDLDPGYDYFYQADGGPSLPLPPFPPLDVPERGIMTEGDVTYIGWITPGDWWRYTFDVPEPKPGDPEGGWIKLVFRVSSPTWGTLAAYWDEVLIGTVSCMTDNRHIFTYAMPDEQIQTTPGEHTLRVKLVSGQMNFDKIGVGFNWSAPTRWTIFEQNFDDYTNLYTYNDVANDGWTVINGAGEPLAAWMLWNTSGELLGNEDPDIAAMTENYMITDSDFAPGVDVDEELISPVIDCTYWQKVRLDFRKNFKVCPDDLDHLQIGEVDIRVPDEASGPVVWEPFMGSNRRSVPNEDGRWGQWVNLLHFDRTTVAEEDSFPERVDISSYADGKKIQIRWHYYNANYDYWFAVDEIRVSGESVEPPVIEPPICDDGFLSRVDLPEDCCYIVQYLDDLASGDWEPLPGYTWPATGRQAICIKTAGLRHRFFRILILEP